MNILGIGPGEIILILIVTLVVVGPERLPDLARQAGRMLVRGRNWLQSSPDAAIVLRARQEIENELATLKASLLEVQSVRDEVLDAAKQLNESVSPLTSARLSFDDLLQTPAAAPDETMPAQTEPTPPMAQASVPEDGEPVDRLDQVHQLPALNAPLQQHVPIPAAELENLTIRLNAIMADLWALQEQLKQRGVLSADWEPPSYSMHLPDEPTSPPNSQPEEVA